MVDKEGIDGFLHKAMNPCRPPLFLFLFFFATIAPQLGLLLSSWRLMFKASCGFVLEAHQAGAQLALVSVLLFSLASPPRSYNGQNILFVFNLSVILDMGQITVANHSEPFVLPRLKCYTHARTHLDTALTRHKANFKQFPLIFGIFYMVYPPTQQFKQVKTSASR